MSRLEGVVKLMIKAALRARAQMRKQDERFDQRYAALRKLKPIATGG